MTRYQIGDLVQGSVQGMREGVVYNVCDIESTSTIVGAIVRYLVAPCGNGRDGALWISNGHLVLRQADAPSGVA